MSLVAPPSPAIENWKQFTKLIRSQGCQLLRRLGDFPGAILVAGCQRSGTTIVSRVITRSEGMANYWFGADDELDAALILAGAVEHTPQGRYCFQTTYVDECYQEYYEHGERFKLVWVIRNPYSVAYSLMHNWAPGALQGTFDRCGIDKLPRWARRPYRLLGRGYLHPAVQASLLYKAKTLQMMELKARLGPEQFFVMDYDDLILHKDFVLPSLYDFLGLKYHPAYGEQFHARSIQKKQNLSTSEMWLLRKLAVPVYEAALPYRSVVPPVETP